MTAKRRAINANQRTPLKPTGITIRAANNGPAAKPPLPPTWKILCAKPLRPPEACCATCEPCGWNIEEPKPNNDTDNKMTRKLSAYESIKIPMSVNTILTGNCHQP